MNSEESSLISRGRTGDKNAIGELLERHRERLRLGVELRQNPLVRGRFDASDVVQEAFVEATERFAKDYDDSVPLFVWLRFLVQQRLFTLTRRHLGAQKRNAAREAHCNDDASNASQIWAEQFVASQTSPSMRAHRKEMQSRVESLLETLDRQDRTLLMLRHDEQLSNVEAAAVLGMNPSTASSRYLRAIEEIRKALQPST